MPELSVSLSDADGRAWAVQVELVLNELLHRWNAEAGENEYYHGLLSDGVVAFGFGGQAYQPGTDGVADDHAWGHPPVVGRARAGA